MDDREQFKEIQARLASALSTLVLEIAKTRAFAQATLISQGKILLLLGRSEEQVKSDIQEAITLSVSHGLTNLEDSVLAEFEQILKDSERRTDSDPG